MDGLQISGNVFVDRLDDSGDATGLIGPINVTKLAIKTPSEENIRTSNLKESRGLALGMTTKSQPTEVEMEFDSMESDMLSMILLGETATLNSGAGSVSDESVTLYANQRWADLAQSNLASDGITVTLDSDDSELTAGTDYEINYAAGIIRALSGGAVENGGAITIAYAYNATSGNRLLGGIKSQVKLRILMEGDNLDTGAACKLEVFKAVMAPSNAVDLMSAGYITGTLAGKALVDSDVGAPFRYDELDS